MQHLCSVTVFYGLHHRMMRRRH